MKQKAGAVNIRLLFIFIQIILYVSFLTIDITGDNITLSSEIKYSIIILCFCYALFSKGSDKSILFCLKAALFFTVISDLFLLILDYYFYGVLTFIIVQQLYGIRLSLTKYRGNECKKRNEEEWKENESLSKFLVKDFLFRLGFQSVITLVICFALKLLGVQLEGLLIATAFYFLSILTNTFRGVKAALKNRQDKSLVLFAFGISLFLLCDINVGFFNMSGFLAIPEAAYNVLYSLSSLLMWTFYAPAQVLIALSVTESGLDI